MRKKGYRLLRIARTPLRALLAGAIMAAGIVMPAAAASADPSAVSVVPAADSIDQQIQQASSNLEKIVEQYNKINEELKATQSAIAALQSQLPPLQSSMDTAYANVAAIANNAYRGGPLTTMGLLLNSGSTDSFMDQVVSLNQIARQQQADIGTYTQAKARYDAQAKQLNDTLAQQTAQQKDLASKKTTIESDLNKLYDMRKAAYGAATVTASTSTATPPAVSGKGGVAVRFAYAALGTPYVWAGASSSGYDCSGLTMAAWAAAGVSLPHNAAMQWDAITHISRSALAPGDLVFYNSLGHVAIYVGNNQVIHAPQAGDVVKISSIDMMPPYGYGRPA